MFGWLRGCVGRILLLVLLVAGGVWVWWRNPEWVRRITGGGEAEEALSEPSPELADRTLDRVEALQGGTDGGELRLGDAELSSLIRYALPGVLPPGVDEPTVTVLDGHLHLSARVALDALGSEVPGLAEARALLPDTVTVDMRGTLVPMDGGRAALHVDRVEASGIPLPERYVPEILDRLGRVPVQGLPANALLVPLPSGLSAAYVLGDSLVLVSSP